MAMNPWRQFADEVGGKCSGHDCKKVVATVKGWTVRLDLHIRTDQYQNVTKVGTRMRARCVTRSGFRFAIHHMDLSHRLGKLVGMQDIEVGYPDFDREFVIKGTDEAFVRALFGNYEIRQLVQSQPAMDLRLGRDRHIGDWLSDFLLHTLRPRRFPRNKLQFLADGEITNVERLKSIFSMFVGILNELRGLGLASPPSSR